MNIIHNGCAIVVTELAAIWSEKYADPKLDRDSYLLRVLFKNNSTILTLGCYESKLEADIILKNIIDYKEGK